MAAELSIRRREGGGTVLVERDEMFVYIVNAPVRLRWGYHEQSYRVNLEKLWFSKPSQKQRFRK